MGRRHLKVIELLLQHGTAVLPQDLIPIAEALLAKDKQGRYFIYENIAQQLKTHEGAIRAGIKKILEVLSNIEG